MKFAQAYCRTKPILTLILELNRPMTGPVSEKAVLRLIQSQRATSQIQIARQLGVATNTVHSVIRRLLTQKIIEQAAVERLQIGRPALHYRMRLPAPVLAIQWLGTEWHGGIIYPDKKKDHITEWETVSTPNQQMAVKTIAKNAKLLLKQEGLRPQDLHGCGLSLNAARVSSGQLISSVIPWIADFDVAQLEKVLGCPVWISPAPGSAEAELSIRARENCRRLTDFNVGDGVSAHTCAYTSLWSESESLLGEIGHIVVEPRGKVCGCGHRGCLETVISGPALQLHVKDDIQRGIRTELEDVVDDTPKAFFDALEALDDSQRDSYARTITEEFLDRCAWAVSVIVNVCDPDVVIFSGYALANREKWKERIKALARGKILRGEQNDLRVEFSRTTPRDHLRGIAESAVLSEVRPRTIEKSS